MDPITAAAVAGISWIATQAASGVAEGIADRTFLAMWRGISDRLPALAGTPAGDDLLRGLRRAQLRALEHVLQDYRQVGRHAMLAELSPPDPLLEKALAFCRSSTALPVRWNETAFCEGGLLALAPAEDTVSVSTGAALVEDAVLADLTTALDGTPISARFIDHYRNGRRGRPRFLELFGIYFAEQVKEDAAFRAVLHTRLLLQNAANLAALGSWLAQVEERFGGTLSRLEDGVADLAAEQRAGFAVVLEAISALKNVPLAALRSILERMGEVGVRDEHIQARLEAKADEYLALRDQWSKLGGAAPDIEKVRRDALALIDAGDLDGARHLFVDARGAIREARERGAREEAALLAGEAEIDRLQSRYLAAVDRYAEAETLVAPFDPNARFDYLKKRASTISQHGDEFGDSGALEEAIKLWRQAADLRPRAEAPLDWASTQNYLGNALAILGRRARDTESLVEAVATYRRALEEVTRERVPLDWAATQCNLGNALSILGARESGTERLEMAIVAYHAALEVKQRERVPLNWAIIQNNLGVALLSLGERESGTGRLEEAVVVFRAALEVRPRKRVPLHWAMTQSNLGNALRMLGERTNDTSRLQEGVEACREALKEHIRERVPLDWAMTQNRLGIALWRLGERERGTARLKEAVAAFRAALEEWSRKRVPLDWAMTQNNLGNALLTLGQRESGTERLREAVDAYRAALEEQTRERVPLGWAATQNNLGFALWTLGQRKNGTDRLVEAVMAYSAALEERTRERVPLDWALTQNGLGIALRSLGERESGTERLERAVEAHSAALQVFQTAGAEYYVEIVRANLQRAQVLLERRRWKPG